MNEPPLAEVPGRNRVRRRQLLKVNGPKGHAEDLTMRSARILTALAASLAALLALSTRAAGETPASSPPAAGPAERAFITRAAQESLTEVELGKLAQRRSANPEVKMFATEMVAYHGKALDELRALAARKSLEVPNQLDDEHAKIVHSLGAKPASEFDRTYGHQMLDTHEKSLVLFRDAAALSDRELAAFAERAVPTLERHRQMAGSLPSHRLASAEGSVDPAGSVDADPAARAAAEAAANVEVDAAAADAAEEEASAPPPQ